VTTSGSRATAVAGSGSDSGPDIPGA
jgi:hypothetical protein